MDACRLAIAAAMVLMLGRNFDAPAAAADRLILRNLEILTDVEVASFDEDGVVLRAPSAQGRARYPWDEIERGKVALDQSRFDELLARLGPPLYRVRLRLKTGDYEGLAEPAERLYPTFAARTSQSAYLVCQAAAWSRIALGRREAAVEPVLRAAALLQSGAAAADGLPGARRPALDRATGLCGELLPVWFDAAAAQAALKGVQEAIRGLSQPRPLAAYVYYVSLALAAGAQEEADRVLPSLSATDPAAAGWREILLAQRDVQAGALGAAASRLRSALPRLEGFARPVALYWLGLAHSRADDEAGARDGILALMALAAAYREVHPELAAAGLYHAAAALDKLKEERSAAAVRRELATAYLQARTTIQQLERQTP